MSCHMCATVSIPALSAFWKQLKQRNVNISSTISLLAFSSPPHAVKQGRRGDKMSPRWVDQTFVQRFPAPHNDAPRAHNGTLRDELGRQRRKSLFGAHAWAARGQRASFETALAAAKEEGNLFIIQSKRKKGRGERLHRKARQNTLWGRNEGWIIQGGSGTV